MSEKYEVFKKLEIGSKAGVQVWRINNFKLEVVPKQLHGKFYKGDSYIVLQTKENHGSKSWLLHFWLGEESSKDERGTAAIMAVQIDDYLGGAPVQYRNVQGHECPEFMGCFKGGIQFLDGGIASGFAKIDINMKKSKSLMHIKGKCAVRANEVACKWSSLNHGDCFIIDYNNDILRWNGKECNSFEKFKANNMASKINSDEKGGKGKIFNLDEGEEPANILKIMEEALEGSYGDIGPATSDEVPKDAPKKEKASLYHVSSDTGKLEVKKIGSAPFKQNMLLTGDCYILDNGANGKVFVWKGKKASDEERRGVLDNANKFLAENKYPAWTSVEIMTEDGESVAFQLFFSDWKKKGEVVGFGKQYTMNKIAKIKQTKVDLKALHDPKIAAKYRMVDNGSGKLEIWRVEGELVPVDKSTYGTFYGGDCYVMLYTYKPKRREEYIIYFWLGQHATIDEITACALHAAHLDKKYGDRPVQVRVTQGKEPPHLLGLFQGNPMIILSGGREKSGKDVVLGEDYLIQVFNAGTGIRAIQVAMKTSSLNSNDAFVVHTKDKCWIWVGQGASDDEVAAAKYTAEKLGKIKPVEVKEGKEDAAFWKALGGKGEYANHPRLQEDLSKNPPRLFAISDATGKVSVDEVPGEFVQSDLCEDDVMMLDVWDQVYIWIGKGANEREKRESAKLADEYLTTFGTGRPMDISIITIKQENEPKDFSGFFPAWYKKYSYGAKMSYFH